MKIKCLVFGKYAEAIGTETAELELGEGADVGSALEKLRETVPNGELIPRSTMVAINQSHALADQILEEGDEMAILPPLAGG